MRYYILGADSRSGRDIEMIVDVADRAEAEREASLKGIFVSSIRPDGSDQRTPAQDGSDVRAVPLGLIVGGIAAVVVVVGGIIAVIMYTRTHSSQATVGAPVAPAEVKTVNKPDPFRKSIEPFAREVQGLLGPMDAGLSYNDYSAKVGDIAAAYAQIDRSDSFGVKGMIFGAAGDAYEAFKDAREPFRNHIEYPTSDLFRKNFDDAFSHAAEKARAFLVLYEPGKG
jgi:hypothetical protein